MERGPVFTVFVTAIIPETLPASPLSRPLLNLPTVMYEPGLLKRYFISIPKGASWAGNYLHFDSIQFTLIFLKKRILCSA
jgi:hypothetical protein